MQTAITHELQITPFCFLLRVISRICLIINLKKNNLKIIHFLFVYIIYIIYLYFIINNN